MSQSDTMLYLIQSTKYLILPLIVLLSYLLPLMLVEQAVKEY